jgi:1,4-alpha-glucan branching enzyme
MPYVEGYGTWPFGEEWLWEAMATSYLPLLDVLEAAPELTLSLTPVLCDQLAAPGVGERFAAFLRDVRPETHRRDIADAGDPAVAAELERSAALYAHAGERFGALGGDLLAALAPHAAWTSSATHAVLPLLATDAGVRLQVRTGVESHRARFAAARPWRGGFWSPECAHGAWLDPLLEQEGVHATCVDLTDVLGAGAPTSCVRCAPRPGRCSCRSTARSSSSSGTATATRGGGLPRQPHKTTYEHRPWRNDGAGLRPGRGARAGARDAAGLRRARASGASPAAGCACSRSTPSCSGTGGTRASTGCASSSRLPERGVPLVHLDDALEDVEPVPARPACHHEWAGGATCRRGARASRRPTSRRRATRSCAPSPRGAAEHRGRPQLLALQAATGPSWSRGLARPTARARAPPPAGSTRRRATPRGARRPARRAGRAAALGELAASRSAALGQA